MKYAIIISDGAADVPLDVLDGATPLEVAVKPNTDLISMTGRQGVVCTTPEGFNAGSDICCMSLLGYDPGKYHRGRAPLEAAAMGIDASPCDWIFRCNLVTVADETMMDHSAGHISNTEARQLLDDFAAAARDRQLADGLTFYPGVSYRNLMVDRSGRDYGELATTPPHDVPGERIDKHLPRGGPHADASGRCQSSVRGGRGHVSERQLPGSGARVPAGAHAPPVLHVRGACRA